MDEWRILEGAVQLGKDAARLIAEKEARKKKTAFAYKNVKVSYELLEHLGYDIKGSLAVKEEQMPPEIIFKDGSFRQRYNRLEYRFMFDGEQTSVSGKDKQECYKNRLDTITGKRVVKKALTFKKWLIQWAETYKKNKVDKGYYESILRYIGELTRGLENIPLTRITTAQLQNILNSEKKDNTRVKKGSLLGDSFKKAYATRLIKFNPYLAVEVKKEKGTSYPVLQPNEQTAVYNIIHDKKYKDLFWLSCCTGMRISELLGLETKNIDFENGIITVKQQLDRKGNIKPKLKTDSSYRQIDFAPELFNGVDTSNKFLFDLSYSGTRSFFRRLLKKVNIEFVLHSFRHTFISCCYHIGIKPKQIQLWAGHSKIETTLNTYTHILKGNSVIIDYLKKLKKTVEKD